MDTKERFGKIRCALKEVCIEAERKYLEGRETPAWKAFETPENGGRMLFVRYPGTSEVDIHWAGPILPYGDLGDRIASFSTEYYQAEAIVELTAYLLDTWYQQ